MADRKPLYLSTSGIKTVFATDDTLGIAHGGTGATTAADARTNLGIGIGTDVQAWDSDLDAISALSTTGFAIRTGAGTWTTRSLSAPAAGLTITNSDGVAGTPTFALANDLLALENLSSTGFAVRSNVDTWVQRSVDGTAGRVAVTNGAGIFGNPTIDLATVTDTGTGTFLKIQTDAYGRVTGTQAVVAGDITPLVDSVYLRLSGGTLTNFLTLHSNPTSALHAVTKQYVDSIATGLSGQKTTVRVASTGDVDISNPGTAVFDGVTLTTGDLILLKDQTNEEDNGIYVFDTSSTPLVREAGFDSSAEIKPGLFVFVSEGTVHDNNGFTLVSDDPIVLGTTPLEFIQISGSSDVIGGAGILKTGNQLDIVSVDSTRIQINADSIDLGTPTIGGAGAGSGFTKVSVDAYGRVINTGTATASDVGAQTSSAELTAIAGLSTTGVVVRTGTGAFTTRAVTGTSGNIAVTNGDGVSGAPTIDLVSGVNTSGPGTYTSVTVDTYGRVTSGSTSSVGDLEQLTTQLTNVTGSTAAKGRPVYCSTAGSFELAQANVLNSCYVVGLVADATIADTVAGRIATDGVVAATTGEWDVVTGGSGGLTPSAIYYLSTSTAGQLTTTVPTTDFLVPVGEAISTTKMRLFSNEIIGL